MSLNPRLKANYVEIEVKLNFFFFVINYMAFFALGMKCCSDINVPINTLNIQ